MRLTSVLLVCGLLGLACTGGVEAPPAPSEIATPGTEPAAEPAPPAAAAPEAPASPTAPPATPPKVSPKPPSTTKPAPEPKPEPVKAKPATVSFAGDAKEVWLLGDGNAGNFQAGEVPPGPYKVKAWFGSVPAIAGNVRIGPGEVVVITCDAKKKRCERS